MVPFAFLHEMSVRSFLRKVKWITCFLLVLLPSLLALACSPTPATGGQHIQSTAGTITEFALPTAGSQPEGITSGPDRALWFADFGDDKIGRITTGGTITEFSIPTVDSRPYRITSGPDQALWFTEAQGNKIGRITTSGSITEFALPTTQCWPAGITRGPDNRLWFTEKLGTKIGQITTA